MIVGLKESIPCDQVISRNNNYRTYLNERQGTHLIFYLSEGALTREGGGAVIWVGALIKFFSYKEERSFERGIHLGWSAVSDNYDNAA